MQNFRTIKGTHDLLPNELIIWRAVENFIHNIMQQNGYGEIRTPAFENTELFVRGIGTDTDIVTKEMYSWTDQGGNTLTLKPELTAPVARAYLQHQMGNQNPIHRLYYIDALFRRERPQKGRQRQFHQFGAEAIGSPNPEQDAEIIALAYNIYKKFNIQDMSVRLNSIGNAEIRPLYLETLRSSIKKIEMELCTTCQTRIEKNALRLFDCKNPHCQELLDQYAPFIYDSISDDDRNHFEMLTRILKEMEIPYFHDKKLVRGLDYYSHTTFEITSSVLGAQDALCGGGRYNGLIEQLGGKSTPAVGFAAGVERLILAINKQNNLSIPPDIYFIHLGDEATVTASKIANDLRLNCGKIVVMETLRRSLKAQMREAGRCGANTTIILGEKELAESKIIVKDMSTGNQNEVPISELSKFISSNS
ncbi:MAG: histidine--tRNA ligase [Candidatus Marinimicrobia bacterium]|nr:histidine--tRNA ligase [Candidatus Neomarinimicrobiota bacterium]